MLFLTLVFFFVCVCVCVCLCGKGVWYQTQKHTKFWNLAYYPNNLYGVLIICLCYNSFLIWRVYLVNLLSPNIRHFSKLAPLQVQRTLFRLKWKWKSLSRVRLCDPMECGLPSSSVHEIFQARILEWVAMPSSRKSSRPREGTHVSHIAGRFFTILATREALFELRKV